MNAAALAAELSHRLEGEVRFDDGSRALYASDASNYRHVPIGVVIPRSVDDVVACVEICRRHDAPLLPRGAGTSLCGQGCNVAVVVDFTKHLNRIIGIDPDACTARVQPGVVLDDLRAAARKHGLTFAPDPATHNHNTLGGMIGNNSCGPHSVMGGTTVENVVSLEVLTYEGERFEVGATDDDAFGAVLREGGRRAEIYRALRELGERCAPAVRERFVEIPRRVSGYNLSALLPECGFDLAKALVGTEGTCVTVLSATLRLIPEPPARILLVLGYPSVYEAADHVVEVMRHGPVALEGVDENLVEDMRRNGLHAGDGELLPEGRGWLLVEFGGATREEATASARRLMDTLGGENHPPAMRLYDSEDQEHRVWQIRESGLGATAHVPGEALTWEGWEDSAVPPQRLGEYLRDLRQLFRRYGYQGDLYGHFGQGCVHTRINFDLVTTAGIAKFRRFVTEATRLVVRYGGSISGEHGDGQSKAELLPIMFGHELVDAFAEFKRVWDPRGRMNPGRVVDPRPLDADLRLGAGYRPRELAVRLHYPEDRDDFARATLRCVGVGECRKSSGTMCPSFMATGEEMHSTRGRARLLHEMAAGDVLTRGWREEAVREALELCLSCKACKKECPVSVDMAAYKAEFMHHYHRHRRRPLNAHAFGRIDRWARLGGHAPRIVNALAQSAAGTAIARRLLGLAPERPLPRLPAHSFRDAFEARGPSPPAGQDVILWPDTFNNHFDPAVLMAATEVLERLGWRVHLPPEGLCCGRPLYEFGMLDTAERYLRRIIDALAPQLVRGTPIVALEPACLSVFREELPRLLPHDMHARRLRRQVVAFDRFVAGHVEKGCVEAGGRRALVHPHCHQHAVLDSGPAQLLTRAGFEVDAPDSGCCGMAGAFGYAREKYEVSVRCAERVLLPAVRHAAPDTAVVADGYSCREQIRHLSGCAPMHLAQLLNQTIPGVRPP